MKKKKVINAIVFSVLLIALIFIVLYFALPQELGGATFLAISNIEIVDNGNFIRIYGVATGAEQISIDFTSEEITQHIEDEGYKATKSLIGAIKLEKQVKKFPIIKQTDQNFVDLKNVEVGKLATCSNNAPTGYIFIDKIPTLSLTKKSCLFYSPVGTNSIFSGQSIEDSLVSFNIGGATGTLAPAQGSNVVILNDGQTKIEWVGSLNNYNQITPPSSYSILFHESNYQKLIRGNAYSLEKDEWNVMVSCLGGKGISEILGGIFSIFNFKTLSEINSCVGTFNNRALTILKDRTSEYESSINANDVYFTSNSMDVDLKVASSFPTFIITLDADKVGIIELAGKPRITNCVQNKIINSGDTYSTSVSVQNMGDSDGSFYGKISCDGDVSGTLNELYVGSFQTVNMPAKISGTNINPGTIYSNCVATVIDRKSQDSDSCSFSIGVKYQSGIVCEPSSENCIDDVTLRICSSDGTSYVDEECEEVCVVMADGSGKCDDTPPPPPPITCDKWYQDGSYSEKETCGLNPACWIGLKDKTVKKRCLMATWIWFTLGILILSMIFLTILLRKGRKRYQRAPRYPRYPRESYGRQRYK